MPQLLDFVVMMSQGRGQLRLPEIVESEDGAEPFTHSTDP